MLLPVPGYVLRLVQEPPAENPVTLASLLPSTVWNAASRGPLVLIGAEVAEAVAPLPPPTRTGYNLSLLAAAFGQSLVRVGELTTLGPDRVSHLPPFRRADEVWDAFPDEARAPWSLLLLGELETPQLRKALSSDGLAYSELTTTNQHKLWMRALPETVSLPLGRSLPEGVTEVPFSQAGVPLPRLRARVLEKETPIQALTEPQAVVRLLPPRPHLDEQRVPFRRKTSELDTSLPALERPVPLAGIATVEALLVRLRERTGLPLYADKRLLKLTFVARGESARAGDLLAALCRATGSTVRRLDTLFLVTEDTVGLGGRTARLQLQTVAYQPLLVASLYRLAQQGFVGTVRTELLFSGFGAVPLGSEELPVLPARALLPPITLTTRLKERGFQVRAPEDPSLTTRLVAALAERGFTTVFVPFEESKAFDRLRTAAQERGLGVVPLLSPLQTPTGEDDRNIEGLGLTEALALPGIPDWERWLGPFGFSRDSAAHFKTPESVDVVAFAQQAARVRALPGVIGLGLWQTEAPGYSRSDTPLDPAALGYSVAARKAFFLQHGIDPIDFGGLYPFYPDARSQTLQDAWQEACAKRRDAFLARVDAALKAAHVAPPLAHLSQGTYCTVANEQERPFDQWRRWQGRALDPPKGTEPTVGASAIGPTERPAWLHLSWARAQAESSLSHVLLFDDQLGVFSQWVTSRLRRVQEPSRELADSWDGVVLDLSDLPPASALRVLEATIAR